MTRRKSTSEPDVAARLKALQEALRRAEDKNRAILSAMPDLMFCLSRDGTFLEFFSVKEEDLYVPAEQIVGKSIRDLIPHVADRAIQACTDALDTGKTQLFEYSLDMPDGKRHFEARHAPFGDSEVLAIIRDVTQREEARQEREVLEAQMQLTQKLESLGVLAGGIAHDFNNLLTSILGNVGLAVRELDSSHPVHARLRDIERGAERAADLTAELLAYSGKAAFVVEPLDLAALAREMVHLLHTAISKKAQLSLDLEPNLPLCEGDATQVRQIMMNLITNASDALEDRVGVVRLTAGHLDADTGYLRDCIVNPGLPAGDYVFIEVTDTGCGMDAETRGHIFEPFFTTKFTGRGLGLAAVLGIVRGHGGTLRIDSEPERGTTIRVLFPVTDRELTHTEEESSFGEPHGTETVLVVDDEEAVRQAVTSILDSAGYLVLVASNGPEAIEMFEEAHDHIDLVLLDMTMPLMDGEETFHALRAIDPDVSVLLTSGYVEQDALGRFGDVGPIGFVQKPYQPATLMQKVAQAIAIAGGGAG